MTQRAQSMAVSSRWFVAVDRTHTTPVLPLEFCFRPMTSDRARSVSPGWTGRWKRHSA